MLLAVFCAPLLLHIYLGSYSRFIADDFCSSAAARSRGIIRGTVYWYMIWTGRFSANFLDSLFGYLGPRATPFATGLVVTVWFVVLVFALVQILRSEEESRLLLSGVISAMILFAVLEVIPFIGQSLYWGQGMRSVVPPLILGTSYVALISYRSRAPASRLNTGWFITAALLTFVAAGFAETWFAVQTTAMVFGLVIPLALRQYTPHNPRSYFLLLIAGLAGSLAGGLVMFVAPGNKFRQSAFPPPPHVPELLGISFRGLREFFELVLLAPGHSFVWLGVLLCGFIFGLGIFQHKEKSATADRYHAWAALLWLPAIVFVLLMACWVPMAWGTSLTLAYRTMIIPAYVLVCLAVCWVYVAGRVFRHLLLHRTRGVTIALSLVALLAFAGVVVESTRRMWKQRSVFAGYARVWDEREALIQNAKSQGLSYAVVYRLHNWAALDEIAVDPKITWLTKCVQEYYGIGVIPDLGDLYGEPNGPAKQAALEHQFDAIPKLPGSVPTDLDRIYHTVRGKIGFYKTTSTSEQIKSYYQTELARLGWKYIGEKIIETDQWSRSGTQQLFCNGETAATLFITGKDEDRLGYTYSLALNWGMSSGFVWGEVDCPR